MEKLDLEKTFSFNVNENNYPIVDIQNCGIHMTEKFYNQLGDRDSFFDFFADDEDETEENVEMRNKFDIEICKHIVFDILPFSFEYFKIVNEEFDEEGEDDDYDDEY